MGESPQFLNFKTCESWAQMEVTVGPESLESQPGNLQSMHIEHTE